MSRVSTFGRGLGIVLAPMVLSFGCAGGTSASELVAKTPAVEPETNPAEPNPDMAAPVTSAPGALAPAAAAVDFQPLSIEAPRAPTPHVEILFPRAEQRILVDKANAYEVRLALEHWDTTGWDAASCDAVELCGVQLKLDDFSPRSVPASGRTALASLLPADAELLPGAHRLVALLTSPSGTAIKLPERVSRSPFAAVRFYVTESASGATSASAADAFDIDAPMLVYLLPQGTYNGDLAADRITIDFLPLNVSLGRDAGRHSVRARVTGPTGVHETRLYSAAPVRVTGLSSGDYDFELSLIDSKGEAVKGPYAWVGQTITINRDAPVPGASSVGTDAESGTRSQ